MVWILYAAMWPFLSHFLSSAAHGHQQKLFDLSLRDAKKLYAMFKMDKDYQKLMAANLPAENIADLDLSLGNLAGSSGQ